MIDIFLYNTASRKKEKFVPLAPPKVTMYTCGLTVYDYASIGNFRTYTAADVLFRVLKYNGYGVTYVMNFTDVGHLTGDNIGNADLGEDRVEKSARESGKSAWDIANFYIEAFLKDFEKLNLEKPKLFAKATDHIKEQIELVRRIEEKGFAYKISDGIYFDTAAFETKTGKKYGELSTLDEIRQGARVEVNPEKKNPRDFALWKFSYPEGRSFDPSQDDGASRRQMEWESPWGLGFPGWHIECSAMSMKYLGETFDIHTGGEDLRQTHHPNEIAQAEGATGKPFVRYWIHVTFLKVDGQRMGKSLGNVYTVSDIEKKGFDPLALRYLYLTAYYRDSLNFTWESLDSSQKALDKLREQVASAKSQVQRTVLSEEKRKKIDDYSSRFRDAINDDLNTPTALAILWEALKSNIPSEDKYDLAITFDEVLGLKLATVMQPASHEYTMENSNRKVFASTPLSGSTLSRLDERELARIQGDFQKADELRLEIKVKNKVLIEDTARGTVVKPSK